MRGMSPHVHIFFLSAMFTGTHSDWQKPCTGITWDFDPGDKTLTALSCYTVLEWIDRVGQSIYVSHRAIHIH